MKRSCRRCRTKLSLSNMRCPYCRELAVSWVHRIVIAALAVPVIIYLLRAV